jgi:hypothetical protein
VPQSFARHSYPNITRTSAKASATSHVKKLTTKNHMSIYCHKYYYNKPNNGHQTKDPHIKHQDNQSHKPLFKIFESKSVFTDYYTIAPVFNTRSIIHGNTK